MRVAFGDLGRCPRARLGADVAYAPSADRLGLSRVESDTVSVGWGRSAHLVADGELAAAAGGEALFDVAPDAGGRLDVSSAASAGGFLGEGEIVSQVILPHRVGETHECFAASGDGAFALVDAAFV